MKTYAQGTRHKGKVLRLLPFGAFVELAGASKGCLHTSDLSYKRIEHPSEVLKENEEIDVVVADRRSELAQDRACTLRLPPAKRTSRVRA